MIGLLKTQPPLQYLRWSFWIARVGWYFTLIYQSYIGFSFCGEMAAWNQYFSHVIRRDDNNIGWCCHTYWHTDCRSIRQPPIMEDATELLMRTLGVTRRVAKDELGMIRVTSVRLEWLCSHFSYVTDADMEAQIKCMVRDYLLYLIGALYLLIKAEYEFLSRMLVCLKTSVLFQLMHGAQLH